MAWLASEIAAEQQITPEEKERQRVAEIAAKWVKTIYDTLYERVYSRLVVKEREPIFAGFRKSTKGDDSPSNKRFKTTLNEVKRLAGINIKLNYMYDETRCEDCDQPGDYIMILMRSNPETPSRQDFAELFAEAERRNRLWKEYLPAFAKHCVEQCAKQLGQVWSDIQTKNQAVDVVQNDYVNFKTLGDSFQFADVVVDCRHFTRYQCEELIAAMNDLIDGGFISSEMISFQRLIIHRAPHKPPVQNPVFDFGAFCKQFEEVTPVVQQAFNVIADNLQAMDEPSQIRSLEPKRRLTFWSADFDRNPEMQALNKRLFEELHWNRMLEAVESSVGVIILSAVKHNYYHRDFRYDFDYDIPDGADSDILKQQLAIERKIKHIVRYKARYVAKWLVNLLLDELQKLKTGQDTVLRTEYSGETHLYNVPKDTFLVPLNRQFAGLAIDLFQINPDVNGEFLADVESWVKYYSNDLIHVDFLQLGVVEITAGELKRTLHVAYL